MTKIDYDKTIEGLKESGLIAEGDKYAVCVFQPEDNVTTTTVSLVDYLITANDDEIKLFDLNQKTGEYLGHCAAFKKADIVYSKKLKERKFIYASKGLFGGMYIAITFMPENFAHTYIIPKKYGGYEQAERRADLFGFVKSVYNTVYDTQEKQIKGKI